LAVAGIEMKLSPRMLAVLVFVGGLVVIAYQVYELDRFRREVWAMRPHPVDAVQPVKPANEMSLGQLTKQHLMGEPNVQPAKTAAQGPIVDTNLKLELVGTIRGGLDEKDSALIRAKGKDSKRYYVGEQIEGGALLDTVNEDAVILKRGGALETLRYTKDESAAAQPAQSVTNNAPVTPVSAKPQPVSPPGKNATTSDKQQAPLSLKERLKRKAQGATPQDNPQND